MRYIQELIQKAHDKGLLRYAQPNLVWDEGQDGERQFELRRTAMSGVEFGYNLTTDEITWAIQSIDGVELEPSELLQELIDKTSDPKPENDEEPMRECDQCGRTEPAYGFLDWVNGMCERCDPGLINDPENQRRIKGDWDEQPCQHYAQTRAIVDEEPEVTEHSTQAKWDRGLNRYIVTETTTIDAYSEEDALERVVSGDKSGKPEVVSQEAEIQPERWRVGRESYFWAENREHAIEQYLDMMNNDNGYPNVAEIVSYE